ncbi:hypothetical protein [Paenibacillus chungangensis]|uniref:Uncharacterized protein n=1 Tax=Paenibacillus chungangensis TaxID=696535 RepID=A0ABW3HNE4_9BACL
MMGMILMIIIYFLLGALIVKLGIDNSKATKQTQEIVEELREIKEILKYK